MAILETITIGTQLKVIQCGECGGIYALNKRYVDMKWEGSGYWTCPYCICSWGYGKSEIDRMKEELKQAYKDTKFYSDRLANERAAHEQTQMSLRGHKAAKTRLINRVSKGICPCCNRYFKNLHAHMENQHSDYCKEE